MSFYSPIAPIALLEQLFQQKYLGNYLLLLAHDVLHQPKRYAEFMVRVREDNPDTFIIMDNSVIELGTAIKFTDVVRAAEIVDASCVMTPDVLGNFSATQTLVLEMNKWPHLNDFPLMCVPQGSSMDEVRLCIDWLMEMLPESPFPTYWGVPRWIANKLGSREEVIRYINLVSTFKIHLLGMSHNFEDDVKCARMPNVMGIDSANPLVMGMNQQILGQDMHCHYDRDNYWGLTKLTDYMSHNVGYMHALLAT